MFESEELYAGLNWSKSCGEKRTDDRDRILVVIVKDKKKEEDDDDDRGRLKTVAAETSSNLFITILLFPHVTLVWLAKREYYTHT
jgi:hypothetical protein